jgi:putative heme iron utilization protein
MEAIHPVRLDFGEKLAVRSFNLRIESLDQREPVHVHLWDVEFE